MGFYNIQQGDLPYFKMLADTYSMSCTAASCNLLAVSFVKPSGYLDGHPASSKPDLLAGFIKKIVDLTKGNPTLWANTVIFITMDEGGGYYVRVMSSRSIISATERAFR